MLDSEFDDDTELLAIADTLVSLGAPPTYRPPPLPVQPPQWANSAPTPAGIGGHQDSTHISLPGCRIVSRSDDVKKHHPVISQLAR